MKFYSQKSYSNKLGTCNTTIKANGCFVTSYAMLDGRTPAEVNRLFTKKGGYHRGCMVIQSKCSAILGLKDKGKTTNKPNYICIAETNHYKRFGVPQHFYIWNPNGNIIDPLDKNPVWRRNSYNIVSYRLIKLKKPMEHEDAPNKNEAKLLKFIKDKILDWKNRLNSKERKTIEKKIETYKKDNKILHKQFATSKTAIEELEKANYMKTKQIIFLKGELDLCRKALTASNRTIDLLKEKQGKETQSTSLLEKIKKLLNI